jgi:hypothetical protein
LLARLRLEQPPPPRGFEGSPVSRRIRCPDDELLSGRLRSRRAGHLRQARVARDRRGVHVGFTFGECARRYTNSNDGIFDGENSGTDIELRLNPFDQPT